MKKKLIFIGLLFTGIIAFAQDIPSNQVPSVVLNQFNIDYPKARDVEWELKNNIYNVEFEKDWYVEFEAWYSATGNLIKEEEELSQNKLPKLVTATIKSKYPMHHIDDAEKITENKKISYKVEIEKGNEEQTLFLNENGTIIK